jgi:hypothetical protein
MDFERFSEVQYDELRTAVPFSTCAYAAVELVGMGTTSRSQNRTFEQFQKLKFSASPLQQLFHYTQFQQQQTISYKKSPY